MLADDLRFKYGWYKWRDGFRQKDGFFVDRIGRVIFWPDAGGRGYVLDDATAEKIAKEPAAAKEVDLSGNSRVFGPRPKIQDELLVAKATPGTAFWMARLWGLVQAVGASGLFVLLVLQWGWNGAGHIFWGIIWAIIFGAVALFFALVLILGDLGLVRRRFSSLTLDYLFSRIKVRDGLTLAKLSRKADGAVEILSADDLEYGWYRWRDGSRQEDGFFVDGNGRVIFWPDAKGKGPGYLLDDATAEKIGESKKLAIEEKDAEKAKAELNRATHMLVRRLPGSNLGRMGGPIAVPLLIGVAAIALIALIAKWASSRGGDAVAKEEAAEPPETEEIDLSRFPEVAGPRPTVRDSLIVAKAMPDLLFLLQRLGQGVVAIGAFWLFGLVVWYWGWDSGGNVVISLVLILIGAGMASSAYDAVRLRRAPLTLEDLVSRIKVQDGLTLPKLAREKDSSLDVTAPEELHRLEDPESRRMRDFPLL